VSTSGSGLGLAIAQAIAQGHGAQLRLAQSPTLGGLRVELAFNASAPNAETQRTEN
jgi:two-component system OmpR family sensor kinase